MKLITINWYEKVEIIIIIDVVLFMILVLLN